ncbi:MAG: hypothetical protein IJS74_02750 [Clostridia bacterium]|nr:hypothetical protein [Clostridia bacterium]
MKKIKSIIIALMMVVSLSLLSGCGNQKANADGFEFTYKAKAEATSENQTKYLKIALSIKNTKNQENTLEASKFTLKKGEETANTSAIIGNNIIDAMEEETFAKMATIDTTITLTLSGTLDGTYQLYYSDTKLFEINAQKASNTESNNQNSQSNTNNNSNSQQNTDNNSDSNPDTNSDTNLNPDGTTNTNQN